MWAHSEAKDNWMHLRVRQIRIAFSTSHTKQVAEANIEVHSYSNPRCYESFSVLNDLPIELCLTN